jgi:hypothetical protein
MDAASFLLTGGHGESIPLLHLAEGERLGAAPSKIKTNSVDFTVLLISDLPACAARPLKPRPSTRRDRGKRISGSG